MTPFECPKTPGCGRIHARCAGHSKRADGAPCNAQPVDGSDKCRHHAGRRAEVIKAEFTADREARRLLGQLGVSPIDNPLERLQELAAEVLAWQDICRTMVGTLSELRYKAAGSGEQLRAEIGMYERSLDRSSKVLEALVRLNIEERLVRLADRQAALMSQALDWLLSVFDCADSELARSAVAMMLRSVAAGEVPARLPRPLLRLVPMAAEIEAS